jgi:hypothetical protein
LRTIIVPSFLSIRTIASSNFDEEEGFKNTIFVRKMSIHRIDQPLNEKEIDLF